MQASVEEVKEQIVAAVAAVKEISSAAAKLEKERSEVSMYALTCTHLHTPGCPTITDAACLKVSQGPILAMEKKVDESAKVRSVLRSLPFPFPLPPSPLSSLDCLAAKFFFPSLPPLPFSPSLFPFPPSLPPSLLLFPLPFSFLDCLAFDLFPSLLPFPFPLPPSLPPSPFPSLLFPPPPGEGCG